MLTKDEIETAVKNGMVFNRKPTEPVLTSKLYDLLIFAYNFGYGHGVRAEDSENEYEIGIVKMLNDYFKKND